MNIFTTFEFTEDNINELVIKLINIYPIYFQEPDRIREIIKLFKLEHSNNITLIIESNHVDSNIGILIILIFHRNIVHLNVIVYVWHFLKEI